LDEFGTKHNTRLEGLSARCFLHELDHLNGVRMIDDMKPLALKMARQKANKLVKKIIRKSKREGSMK
jgi:peptide deformylase